MDGNHDLSRILKKFEISDFAVLLFNNEFVMYKHKLDKLGFLPKSIIVCLFPNYFGEMPKGFNLSRYASAADYHKVIGNILKQVCMDLKSVYKEKKFTFFVDDSPFLEKDMACFGGLCIRGKNDLCLNDKYGSYFNIGEIVTDFEFEPIKRESKTECCKAMPCITACPTNAIFIENDKAVFLKERCLSYISQKKTMTKQDEILFKKAKTLWGCDLCQAACVKNKGINKTHIKEFLNILPDISLDEVENLSQTEYENLFCDRVFSWRPKQVIERNLKLYRQNNISK